MCMQRNRETTGRRRQSEYRDYKLDSGLRRRRSPSEVYSCDVFFTCMVYAIREGYRNKNAQKSFGNPENASSGTKNGGRSKRVRLYLLRRATAYRTLASCCKLPDHSLRLSVGCEVATQGRRMYELYAHGNRRCMLQFVARVSAASVPLSNCLKPAAATS